MTTIHSLCAIPHNDRTRLANHDEPQKPVKTRPADALPGAGTSPHVVRKKNLPAELRAARSFRAIYTLRHETKKLQAEACPREARMKELRTKLTDASKLLRTCPGNATHQKNKLIASALNRLDNIANKEENASKIRELTFKGYMQTIVPQKTTKRMHTIIPPANPSARAAYFRTLAWIEDQNNSLRCKPEVSTPGAFTPDNSGRSTFTRAAPRTTQRLVRATESQVRHPVPATSLEKRLTAPSFPPAQGPTRAVPPPPPPPPPPLPELAAAPTPHIQAPDLRSALMKQIQVGVSLKKVEPASPTLGNSRAAGAALGFTQVDGPLPSELKPTGNLMLLNELKETLSNRGQQESAGKSIDERQQERREALANTQRQPSELDQLFARRNGGGPATPRTSR